MVEKNGETVAIVFKRYIFYFNLCWHNKNKYC